MHPLKKKILLFTTGFVILILLLNLSALKLIDITGNRAFKQDEALIQQDSIDYLFIGSSRVNRDVEEDSINNAFKYFGSTETTPYHYYRLKFALKHQHGDVDYSILPAETGMLSFNDMPFLYLGVYWRQHLDIWEFAKNSDDFLRYLFLGIKMKTLPFYQLPRLGLFYADALAKRNAWKELQQKSYAEFSFFEKQLVLNAFLAQHLTYAKPITTPGVNYFEKIVQLSQSEKHPVIFLKYPLTADYQNALEYNFPELKEANKKMDSLIETSHYTRLIDFSDIFESKPHLFLDPHHLNEMGKARFSAMLRDTLQSIKQSGWPHETGN